MSKSQKAEKGLEGRITVAVAGLGRAGWDMHVKMLRDDERYHIVAVMDPVPARRAEAEALLGCRAYADFDSMIEQTAAEVVVVASPSSLHEKHTVAAFARGKHVVCEKPMAVNVAEADRMIAAAAKNDRRLFVHQNHRFGPVFRFLTETIAGGKLGKIFHVAMCSHDYRFRSDWQTESRYGGGELYNAGSHYLDLMLRLLGGKVTDLFCDLKHIADAGDAEDHVKILMRAENGVTGDLEICTKAATTQHAPQWTVLGDAGALTIDSMKSRKAHLKYYDRSQVAPPAPQGTLAAEGRKYTPEANLPWREEDVIAEASDAGTFYDGVYGTLREGAPFRVKAEEVRQVIDVIARCRKQNPKFPGPVS